MWEGENHLIPPNQLHFPDMSCIQNEMIMEDLFDEYLCELEQLGHDINKDTTQAVAAYRAQRRFDDMCQ